MRKIFGDSHRQKVFYDNSYIVLPMLTNDECRDLQLKIEPIIEKYKIANERKYHLTTLVNSSEYTSIVWEEIYPIFDKFQKTCLHDYKIVACNFIVKEPGKGEVNVHQDWSLCDIAKYNGITIWCPLIDTYDENIGTLSLIPHSERIGRTYISCPSAPHYFEDYATALIPYHHAIKVGKGSSVIFEGSSIHSSPSNITNKLRIAIQCTLIPKEAITHYYRLDNSSGKKLLYQYDVEDDFYKYFFINKEKYRNKEPNAIYPHRTLPFTEFKKLHHL